MIDVTKATTTVVLALALALALAAAAAASPVVLDPPGKAGANQYFETIPSTDGNAAPPSGTSTTPLIDRTGLGKSALKQLQQAGADGQAAASFAEVSAPLVTSSHRKQHAGAKQPGKKLSSATGSRPERETKPPINGSPGESATRSGLAANAAGSAGGSAFGGVFRILAGFDAGGIGVFMPILLISGLIGAVVAAGLRRRAYGTPRQPSP